jgi:hypothetical protein
LEKALEMMIEAHYKMSLEATAMSEFSLRLSRSKLNFPPIAIVNRFYSFIRQTYITSLSASALKGCLSLPRELLCPNPNPQSYKTGQARKVQGQSSVYYSKVTFSWASLGKIAQSNHGYFLSRYQAPSSTVAQASASLDDSHSTTVPRENMLDVDIDHRNGFDVLSKETLAEHNRRMMAYPTEEQSSGPTDKQAKLFESAMESLGIDLEDDAFSGMWVNLEGLTPMERFLSGREDSPWQGWDIDLDEDVTPV